MLAYHNNPDLKTAILAKLAAHRDADQLVQGYGYFSDGKGCAVGCTIGGDGYGLYETTFGVPEELAHLKSIIFEGLPVDAARLWPDRFMRAIEPGAVLSRVQWKLAHWLLTDAAISPGIEHPIVRDAVKACADVIKVRAAGGTIDGLEQAASAEQAAMAADAEWNAATAEDRHDAARIAADAEVAALVALYATSTTRTGSITRSVWQMSYATSRWVPISDKLIELLEAEKKARST